VRTGVRYYQAGLRPFFLSANLYRGNSLRVRNLVATCPVSTFGRSTRACCDTYSRPCARLKSSPPHSRCRSRCGSARPTVQSPRAIRARRPLALRIWVVLVELGKTRALGCPCCGPCSARPRTFVAFAEPAHFRLCLQVRCALVASPLPLGHPQSPHDPSSHDGMRSMRLGCTKNWSSGGAASVDGSRGEHP
jgi:hypothetical protein